MQHIVDHPDTITDWQAFKELKRGSRQAADTAAMNAMWDAIEAGRSKEEYEAIFSQTYINVLTMTQLFAYRIPDKYFSPHKVVVPFYARVAYSIVKGEVKIDEVTFSESAVKLVRLSTQLMIDIRSAIEEKVKPVVDNPHVDETILDAIAPHI